MVHLVGLLTYGHRLDHAYGEHHTAAADTLLSKDMDMLTLSIHHALSSIHQTQMPPAAANHNTNSAEKEVQTDTPVYSSANHSQKDL